MATRADIEEIVRRYPKGTRMGKSPDMAFLDKSLMHPLVGDSFILELQPGGEGVALAFVNLAPECDFNNCSFELNDVQLLSSRYQVIGDGEAILFTDPLPPLPGTEKHEFKVIRNLPRVEPIQYSGILLIPRKKGNYVFSDQQLREIGVEAIGEKHPLDKIKEITDDPRVSLPYTHCVVLSTQVYQRGLFATVEMRV